MHWAGWRNRRGNSTQYYLTMDDEFDRAIARHILPASLTSIEINIVGGVVAYYLSGFSRASCLMCDSLHPFSCACRLPNNNLVMRTMTASLPLFDLKRKPPVTPVLHKSDFWSRPKRVGFLYSIWWWWVVGRLRQTSASLHPPFVTLFLREPLTRPRPATLCQSLPTTIQRPALMVFQLPLSCSEHISLWFLLYERHTFWDYAPATPIPILLLSFLWTSDGTSWSRDWTLCFRSRIPAQSVFCCGASVHGHL